MPKTCINEIHKIQRRFIWRENENKRKYHAFKLSTITRPKEKGGLELRNLEIMNEACLSKLGWKLHNEGEDLWCRVMWGKYGRDHDISNMSLKNTDSSF